MSDYLDDEAIVALIEGRNEIRADMPDSIRRLVDHIVDDLIAELGESPEAWRGAIEGVQALINRPLMTYIAGQERGDLAHGEQSFITMVMVVLGQFLSNHLTLANLKMIHENKERES